MKRMFPNLFSPLKVGGVTLKNRIISAPMTYPILTSDGCLTPEAIAFYELRAKGGAAVVHVSELIVHSGTGKYYPVQVTLDAPNAKDSLAAAARAVKRHGAIASMELSHGGMHALVDREKYPRPFGPSGSEGVAEMPGAMIHELLEAYYSAAKLCKEAGFEMLLIHAGHGWLLEQFLSPATNRRTDEYGGSLQNRARFPLAVIDAVRAAVGPDFPLELRVSAEEYLEDGYTLPELMEFARLAEDKIDLLQVSTGSHRGCFDRTHPSMFMPRGVNVHYAEAVRRHVKVPVSAIGALGEPAQLEEIIAAGQADAVVMARALLADPYLPKKAMMNEPEKIVRCCRCFTCMAERMRTGLRICALNPVIGSEYERSFAPPVTTPKNVLVAGGGPAGMEFAITAACRGHAVTLCEKSDRLGGALNAEKGIDFKEDLYRFIETKTRALADAGVTVHLNTEVTPEYCDAARPDVLAIALGARPIVPEIPGADRENVIIANDLPERRAEIGQTVVILGGGLVGAETAAHLAGEGRDVTVVEMRAEIAVDANPRHRPILLAELHRRGVHCVTGARGTAVTEAGLACEGPAGPVTLPADTVIIAVGQRPRTETALALMDGAPWAFTLGDCVRPATVTEAVFRGYFAALDI